MKKVSLLLLNAFLTYAVLGQVPALINYQGVARNTAGNVLPNHSISLRLSIREGNALGTIVYQETRNLKTNLFGMFTVAIGSSGASGVTGAIGSAKWANGAPKFLQVEMDPAGKNNFVDMGTSQLLSVPYAFASGAAFPVGAAGGSLSGTYPNPTLAAGAVTTSTIADGAVTANKLSPDILFGASSAGGDLSGTYPNPTIMNGVVNATKLSDNAVTTAKIDANAVTASKIADGAVTTNKIADGMVTANKLAAGVIPSSLPPVGVAGGDLTGTYPNPQIATNTIGYNNIVNGAVKTNKLEDGAVTTVKIADGSVTAAKLAADVIPASLPPSGTAGGDLSGSYPTPAVSKIQGVTVSAAAPASGQVLKFDGTQWAPAADNGGTGGTGGTGGAAGGDLIGSYPNPQIAPNAISNNNIINGAIKTSKLEDGAVTTVKIADGAVTTAKLAAGVIPTSLPPSGAAGGDLSGTFPNPAVNKIQGVAISNAAPVTGQILRYDGAQWKPTAESGFVLPYSATIAAPSSLFSMNSSSTGTALEGINSSGIAGTSGIEGKFTAASPADSSAGIKAINYGTGDASDKSFGIWAQHRGSGAGIFSTSAQGNAGLFTNKAGNFWETVMVTSEGNANGLMSVSMGGTGLTGVTYSDLGTGITGFNNAGGMAINGVTWSNSFPAIMGQNYGTSAAVAGISEAGSNGIAIYGSAKGNNVSPGSAIVGEIKGTAAGNPAVFKVNGANVARIDRTGTGYFNGGTVNSGADVAEYFEVEGNRADYEPGDVLVISTSSDRTVEKSAAPYSTLVAGVYATQPGVLLTEKKAAMNDMEDGVPMGVIGVIPTKVCMEGGAIKRGDLIVTSSIPGVAMKADPDKVKVGQVIGKALQDFNGTGIQKIKLLVSIK